MRVGFVVTCSCKKWIGYANTQKAADALGSVHVSTAVAAAPAEHTVTVRQAW